MQLVTFLLALGLTARLTRLAVDDSITQPVRDRLSGRVHAGHVVDNEWVQTCPKRSPWRFLHALLDCSWCFSVWASGAVFSAAYLCTPSDPGASSDQALTAFTWVAAAASASYLVGVASTLINKWSYES